MKITGGHGVDVVYDPVGESRDGYRDSDIGKDTADELLRNAHPDLEMRRLELETGRCRFRSWDDREGEGEARARRKRDPKLTASLCNVQIPANLLLLKQASVVGLYWGGNMSKSTHLRTTN